VIASDDADDYKARFDGYIKRGFSPSKARELLLQYIDKASLNRR
jgi:hypothetical protein